MSAAGREFEDHMALLRSGGFEHEAVVSCAESVNALLTGSGFGVGYQGHRTLGEPWWCWRRSGPDRVRVDVTARVVHVEDDKVILMWSKKARLPDGRTEVEHGTAKGVDARLALPPRLVEVLAVVARGDGAAADAVGGGR